MNLINSDYYLHKIDKWLDYVIADFDIYTIINN